MTTKTIRYKSGYKYQLCEMLCARTCVKPERTIEVEYLTLDIHGDLYIKKGYAWDGPSGPTIDTPNFMRGSVVHDALYQLIREGYLRHELRRSVDLELKRICREDGMSWLRSWWVYLGVRIGGGPAASASAERKMCIAPRNGNGI